MVYKYIKNKYTFFLTELLRLSYSFNAKIIFRTHLQLFTR